MRFTSVLVLVGLLALTGLTGCGINGPTTQQVSLNQQAYDIANAAVTVADITLTELRAAGKISDGDWAHIKTADAAAQAALNAWGQNINNPSQAAIAAFEAVLPELLQFVTSTETKRLAETKKVSFYAPGYNPGPDRLCPSGGPGPGERHTGNDCRRAGDGGGGPGNAPSAVRFG